MTEVTRAIETPRGALLVTVRRVTERVMDGLRPEDLRMAARTLLAEAAVLAQAQHRRPEPESATVGFSEVH